MTKILTLMRRLDDSWQGDLIGTVCLFALGYILCFVAFSVGA